MTLEYLTENPAARFFKKTLCIVEMDINKLRHDPLELFTRAVQPALWVLVFGVVFSQLRAIPTGELSYLAFMAPGIVAQSILFIAIFYGITVIWERDLGVIHKFLVSPTPRTALVLGKAMSAGVRALSQVAIVYILVIIVGVEIVWNPINLALVALIAVLSSGVFSLLSLIIASLVKTRERFMGFGQLLTMPLFFTSNAIYPLSIMPEWIQVIAKLNPLTYVVDALRGLMIAGGSSVFGIGWDLLVLFAIMTTLVLIGAKLYPRVVL